MMLETDVTSAVQPHLPVALEDAVLKAYGCGDLPDYSWPTRRVAEHPYHHFVERVLATYPGCEEITCNEIHVSRVIAFPAALTENVVYLSTIGPYACILGNIGNNYRPVFTGELAALLEKEGFLLPSQRLLETRPGLWHGCPGLFLFELLFHYDEELPWDIDLANN